jgi:hypothetical protein
MPHDDHPEILPGLGSYRSQGEIEEGLDQPPVLCIVARQEGDSERRRHDRAP